MHFGLINKEWPKVTQNLQLAKVSVFLKLFLYCNCLITIFKLFDRKRPDELSLQLNYIIWMIKK